MDNNVDKTIISFFYNFLKNIDHVRVNFVFNPIFDYFCFNVLIKSRRLLRCVHLNN